MLSYATSSTVSRLQFRRVGRLTSIIIIIWSSYHELHKSYNFTMKYYSYINHSLCKLTGARKQEFGHDSGLQNCTRYVPNVRGAAGYVQPPGVLP